MNHKAPQGYGRTLFVWPTSESRTCDRAPIAHHDELERWTVQPRRRHGPRNATRDPLCCPAHHVDAASQLHVALLDGSPQRLEQRSTVQPDSEQAVVQVGVSEVEHLATRRRRRDERVDACPPLDDGSRTPEPLEHEQAGWLHHDSRPHRSGPLDPLEQDDVSRCRRARRRRVDAAAPPCPISHDTDAHYTPTRRICFF